MAGPARPLRELLPQDRRRARAEWLCYHFAAGWAQGKRVLDVDCAAGYGSWLLGQSGASLVFGVSEDREALAWARRHFAGPALQFREGGGRSLPLASGDVELAVSFETLERLRDLPAFIEELHRVIAPGGQLLVSTRLTRGPARLHPQDTHHAREYDDRELPSLLAPRFSIAERFGLHRPPGRLRALEPGLGPRLGRELERELTRLAPPRLLEAAARWLQRAAPPESRMVADRWEEAPIQVALARRVG
jgi:SAM-dependent methyltransferase